MEKSIENKTSYGVLMSRVLIATDIYLFKPISIIEGVLKNDDNINIFVDKVGNTYLMSTDAQGLSCDDELSVDDIINEDDLLSKYGDVSMMEAIDQYYLEMSRNIHVGIYNELNDKVSIICFDLTNVLDRLSQGESLVEQTVEQVDNDKEILNDALNQTSGNNLICITVEKFRQLLEIKDNKELHDTLQMMFEEINKINECFGIDTMKLETQNIQEVAENSQNVINSGIEENKKLLNIKEMKDYFDKKIIGQEEAKKDVIRSVFMNSLSDDKHDRNICLLIGPTGSGKTLIAETLKDYLNVPMEIYDTTQLTVPAYKGGDIEDLLSRLLIKTNGDKEKAENGIIVFDEIDKKGSADNSDVSGRGVLNTLLSFLQGTNYDVKYNNRQMLFDTSKLTIFATGAFTNVAEIKSKNNKTIGFNSDIKDTNEDIVYPKLLISDLVKYGNIPIELIGRFSVITQLNGHTRETLKQIILSENGALMHEKNKLAKIGIELKWTVDFIDAVVDKAFELKTGARSLKYTIEDSIKEGSWEVCTNLEFYKAILLTKDTVLDNKMCGLYDFNGCYYNLNDIITSRNIEKEKVKTLGGNL